MMNRSRLVLRSLTPVLVATSFLPSSSCDDNASNPEKKDWIDNITKKGKEVLSNPDLLLNDIKPFLQQESLQDLSKYALEVFESGAPGQVGYGFMMGYCSGYCVKKASKAIAFVIGGVFLIVQVLSYNGYLAVNYEKFQKDVEKHLDVNNDGKVDIQDFHFALEKLQDVASYNMPTGGGFTAGMFMGLKG